MDYSLQSIHKEFERFILPPYLIALNDSDVVNYLQNVVP